MAVKLSPKYQVVIPEAVRTSLGLKAGQQIEVIAKGKVAYLVPIPELKDLQQELKNKISSSQMRDKKDRSL